MSDSGHAIPAGLNTALVLAVTGMALAGLYAASRLDVIYFIPVAIVYSFLMLTVYALMHEAAHEVLHPNAIVNDLMGMVLGWFFPMSFSMLKITHIVHHCCNRTDHEMFDCYYAGDNRVLKFIQWYGVMTGIWWWLIPIGSILLAIAPCWLRSPPFKAARTTAVLFDDFGPAEITRLRMEVALGALFWFFLIQYLNLPWQNLLLMYCCVAFNWSTRQYVTHAFSVRKVRDGAWNLRVSRPMSWILLNGQWDRVHHQHPHVSWFHLPALAADLQYDRGYWRQYWRLWAGPRLCHETGPDVLPRARYRSLS